MLHSRKRSIASKGFIVIGSKPSYEPSAHLRWHTLSPVKNAFVGPVVLRSRSENVPKHIFCRRFLDLNLSILLLLLLPLWSTRWGISSSTMSTRNPPCVTASWGEIDPRRKIRPIAQGCATVRRWRPHGQSFAPVMITDHCHRQERFIIRPSY